MPKNVKCKNCNNLSNNWCERIVDSPDEDMDRDCTYFWQRTNGDRIRAMSDEELAKELGKRVDCGWCPIIKGLYNVPCEDALLLWLKQPAEVDNG